MLGDCTFPVLRCIVADKADAFHPGLEQGVHLGQGRIARGSDDVAVNLLVQLVIGQPFVRLVMCHHLLVQDDDPGDLIVRGIDTCASPGHDFKLGNDVQHVANFLCRKSANHGAASRAQNNQAFARQGPDSLAHRSAGDAKIGAEPGFIDGIARRQPSLDDHVAHAARNKFVQRLTLDRECIQRLLR